MKKQTKTITTLLVIAAMILSIIMSKSLAAKPENANQNYTQLSFGGGATAITDVSNGTSVTITYPNGTVTVTGTGLYSAKEQGLNGQNQMEDKYNVYAVGDVTVTATPNENYTADLWDNGNDLEAATKQYTGLTAGGAPKSIDAVFQATQTTPGGDPQNPPTTYNTTGTINLKAGDSTHAKTYINAAISINDSSIYGIPPTEDESQIPETTTFNDVGFNSGATDTTVTIRCGCLINWKYVGKVKVNGTPYDVPDFSNRDVWLAHHQGQEISFDLTVPKANDNTYTLEVNMEEGHMFVGNFLWTGNPEEQYRPGPNGEREVNDDYIGNAKIQLVGVEYVDATGKTVKKKLSELRDDGIMDVGPTQKYHNYSTTDNYVEFGTLVELNGAAPGFDEGSMVVAEGTKVTLKIVPEYGYQVTAFSINGEDIVTGDNVSEFTLTIHGGNQHIGAKVTKVGNDVKATATEVNAANSGIILGEGTLDSGTARLSIADAELTEAKTAKFEEQVAKFEETAGEEYEIAAIFDINLNQVFYKGNEGSDVWYGDSLENLENPASLELSLNDINMEGAVLVHNIHNEENFEVIEARAGNAETNTKVYPVDSFSTYAVVTRKNASAITTEDKTESEKTEAKNVKTGDYILIACTVFVAASLILVVTKRAKSKKNRE